MVERSHWRLVFYLDLVCVYCELGMVMGQIQLNQGLYPVIFDEHILEFEPIGYESFGSQLKPAGLMGLEF